MGLYLFGGNDMKISEVVKLLLNIQKQCGDIPVRCANIYDDEELNRIECIQSIWLSNKRKPEQKRHIALIEWSD